MKITSEYYSAMQNALSWFYRNDSISIFEMPGSRHRKIKTFGVNWAAKGTQPPCEAYSYARALQRAGAMASGLNSLQLEVDYRAPIELTQEEYEAVVNELVEALGKKHGFLCLVEKKLCTK